TRVVDPVVEAATLQGVVQVARAVRGQYDDRRGRGGHGPELGDAHLGGGEHLEQEGLELVVRAVDLVDEQEGGAALEGGQYRPGEQEAFVVQRLLGLRQQLGVDPTGRLEGPQVQDLSRKVPVVEGLGGID